MKRRETLSSIAAAVAGAALCSATNALPVAGQEPPAASAAVPQAGSFMLTVFLRHDQTKTVDQINEHLKQTGWYDKFPPDGVDNLLRWTGTLFGAGSMQDLALYDSALSAEAVAAHYELGAGGPKAMNLGLIGSGSFTVTCAAGS